MIEKLYGDIWKLNCKEQITAGYYPDSSNEGYYFLEIYSSEASKANAVFELRKRFSADRVAAFGNDKNDITMIQDADYGYAVSNASDELKEMAPNFIGDCNSNAVVKTMEKLFHSKKLV